jgi:hypothetical protein
LKFLKKIQGKPRKKACISLFSLGRIGTFQWVTANPNKKIWPCFHSRLALRAKRINVASVHYFWAPTYHIKISDIRQGKSIGPAQDDECSGRRLAPVGTCGVAMAFQYDRIFYHSYRYSLLLLAALTAIQRPLILALIDECSQGRWGAHGHRSIADLYEPARRHPLQHHADGIA